MCSSCLALQRVIERSKSSPGNSAQSLKPHFPTSQASRSLSNHMLTGAVHVVGPIHFSNVECAIITQLQAIVKKSSYESGTFASLHEFGVERRFFWHLGALKSDMVGSTLVIITFSSHHGS